MPRLLPIHDNPTLAFQPSVTGEQLNSRSGDELPGLLQAQFETENVLGSARATYQDYPEIVTPEDQLALDDPEWSATKGLIGTSYDTPEFHQKFSAATSPSELQWMVRNYEREINNRQVIAEAGMGANLGTSFAVSLIDPFQLAFVGIPLIRGALAARTLAGAGINAVDMGITEAALHATQSERTLNETMLNVGAGAAFGGFIGAALGKRIMDESEFAKTFGELEGDMATGTAFTDAGGTFVHDAGAAQTRFYDNRIPDIDLQNRLYDQVRDKQITPEEQAIVLSYEANKNMTMKYGKIFNPIRKLNPALFMATSSIPMVKRIGETMLESGFLRKGNESGMASLQALDTQAETINTLRIIETTDALSDGYNAAKKAGYDKKIEDFSREVTMAYEGGAQTGIKHLDDTARAMKSQWDKYEQQLVDNRVLTAEGEVLGQEWDEAVRNAEIKKAEIQKKATMTSAERKALQDEVKELEKAVSRLETKVRGGGNDADKAFLKNAKKTLSEKKKLRNETPNAKNLDKMNARIVELDEIIATPEPAGDMAKALTPKGSKWYLPRIFQKNNVFDHESAFIRTTTDDIVKQLEEAIEEATTKAEKAAAEADYARALTREGRSEIEESMAKTRRKITGLEVTNHAVVFNPTGSQFKLRRRLSVRTSALANVKVSPNKTVDFIETDMAHVVKGHTFSMTPELVAKRQGFDLTTMLKQGEAEVKYLKELANTDAERIKIEKEWQYAKTLAEDQELIRTNRYRNTDNPYGAINVAKENILMFNVMRSLGTMAVAALPDIANIVTRVGLRRMTSTITKMVAMPQAVKMAKKDALLQQARIDVISALRVNKVMLTDNMGPGMGGAARKMSGWTKTFTNVTGMNHMNMTTKQFVTLAYSDDIFTVALGKRTMSKQDTRDFLVAGLDAEDFKQIAAQYRKHGVDAKGDVTVHIGNTDLWLDDYGNPLPIQTKLLNVINKQSNMTIISPGDGDLPRWMRKSTGQVVGQFKSFSFAATNRTLIPGVQKMASGDPDAYFGFMTQMMLGGTVYGLKSWAMDKEINTEWNHLVREMIDKSGYFGIFTDVNALTEKLTSGKVGLQALLGGQGLSRYYTRSVVGDMLGPSFGTATDASKALSGLFSGEMTRGDIRAIRRLFPYQNLVWIRKFVNDLENEIAAGAGVE